jgi:hypothetical protein
LPRAPGGNGGGCVARGGGGGGGEVDGTVRAAPIGCGIAPDPPGFGGAGIAGDAPVVEPVRGGAGIGVDAPVVDPVRAGIAVAAPGGAALRGIAADGVIAIAATGAFAAGSLASRIAVSSWRRASDPGGGGGSVFCFLRGDGASGSGAGVACASGAGGSGSTVHPEARSAIRPFVASERRRRVRSSSGTCQR